MGTVTHTELNKHLPLLGVGKVRELYELNSSELLFVTTDRISGNQLSQSPLLHSVPLKFCSLRHNHVQCNRGERLHLNTAKQILV